MEGLKEAALAYASRGWSVFPLAERNKVPAIAGGCSNATNDVETIADAWDARPNLNVAIATGDKSGGLMVIDLDVAHEGGVDGMETLRDWEREHGELPETVTVETGKGGMHLYYYVDEYISCSVGGESGVDIRANGGYVVAPPSIHPNGNQYTFENHPDDYKVAVADENVMAFVRSVQKQRERSEPFKLPDKIGDGKRNDTLMRYACSMQSRGDDTELIIEALKAVNLKKCDPPLSESEVEKIVESVTGLYPKGEARGLKAAKPRPRESVALMLTDKGKPMQSIENCCRAMDGDPALAGRFYYDLRAYTKMISGHVPWNPDEGERAVSDADYCGLAAYLEREHGLMSKQKAIDAVILTASRNRRNVVAEWLDSLKWDGNPRIMTLLQAFLGCEPSDYNSAVMRLFMLGAVARAYEPGTKFDYMPVFAGAQGLGKSMFLRRLGAKSEWYCDNLNTLEGDAAAEKLRGMWIVEMAELMATKRSKDVEGIKAFITSTVDTIRPKYARETEQRPRGCVFAGTTNDMQFLTDTTGNRRFLPVECGVVEPQMSLFDDGAEEWFEQAWAEAVHIWKEERPKLVLSRELMEVALKKQEQFLEEDPLSGIIQKYLDDKLAEEARRAASRGEAMDEANLRTCAAEIVESAIPDTMKRSSHKQLINQVNKAMMSSVVGWQRADGKQRCRDYGIQRCYLPTSEEVGRIVADKL